MLVYQRVYFSDGLKPSTIKKMNVLGCPLAIAPPRAVLRPPYQPELIVEILPDIYEFLSSLAMIAMKIFCDLRVSGPYMSGICWIHIPNPAFNRLHHWKIIQKS